MSRYRADELLASGTSLLVRAGLGDERARVVAEVLLEGDLLGHTTHGLDLLPRYLAELGEGRMAKTGEPKTLSDQARRSSGMASTCPGRGS